ncbi:MAG: adenylyltransferase/cytidyltransferase family protein [bacterium]|nr:adenylyltransferase/cytidyltransferase family protein [bacterium]
MQPKKSFESKKILSRQALAECVQRLKLEGKTIVTTNGSFDLLHMGHVTMLQEAKSLGNVLIVGLNSDAGIRRYKGKYRPICPETQRAGMLAALACVDYITIFDELTPIELLGLIQPHIHVNSPEHGKDCVEREVVEQHGGRIHLAQLVAGMSTTQLIGRIRESLAHTSAVAIFIRAESLLLALADLETREQREEALRALFRQFIQQGFQFFIFHSPADPQTLEDVEELLGESALPERHDATINFCRSEKPATELFEQLADERDLILAKSVVISHVMQDVQAGRTLNCKTIFFAHPQAESGQAVENAAHVSAQTLQALPELLLQL